MAGEPVNVFCSEVDRDGSRVKVANAWIYWRTESIKLVLRADARGIVLQSTGGDPKNPASYTQQFIAKKGEQVEIAYNTEATQLSEKGIVARLQSFTVVDSLSAALAAISAVNVPANGKRTVTVLPMFEAKLPKYHPVLRAVAVTRFGGAPTDVHARNMEKFLNLNYAPTGNSPKVFRGDEARGFREELRRVVPASGAAPLNIIRDIETAAASLVNDDANERVVALPAHSNNEIIGRTLAPGDIIINPLTLRQLDQLSILKADFEIKRAALKRAENRLTEAKKKNDPEAIAAAQEEVESRKADLQTVDPKALPFLDAFAQTADALERAHVDVIELQSCGAGAASSGVAALGFLSKLSRFLSTRTHIVSVKGHDKAIFSNDLRSVVELWIGGANKSAGSDQESTTSLPIP